MEPKQLSPDALKRFRAAKRAFDSSEEPFKASAPVPPPRRSDAVRRAQAEVIAAAISGGGFYTRQRRRRIERECAKANEDPAPYLEMLRENTVRPA